MASIHLDESFNRQQIPVKPGDVIELQLEESPTTSYRWEISDVNNTGLEVLSSDYIPHETAGIGGGGIKIFHLKVIKPGGQLKLENKQSWSRDVYKTFQVSFV